MERIDKLLKKLSEADAVTGTEARIHEIIRGELSGFADRIDSDPFGDIIAHKPGREKGSALLCAHLDEVGLMVREVEGGYIRVVATGIDVRILPGQVVKILVEPPIHGVIGIKPPHLTTKEERDKVIPIKDLFIDTGLSEEELKRRVKVGDSVCFHAPYQKLQGELRTGKAFDDRAGVVSALEVFRQVDPYYDLYLILSAQEEFSGLGATIASYRINPDLALVIDVTHAPHPDQPEYRAFPLNKGPVIGVGPTLNRDLYERLKAIAKELEIPYQIEPLPRNTGTDADSIAFNREGIPTALLSIPLNYMHSPVEVVSLRDIDRTVRLLISFFSHRPWK